MDQVELSSTATVAASRSSPDLGDDLKDSARIEDRATLVCHGPLPMLSYFQQLRVEAQLHSGSSTTRADGLDFRALRLGPKTVALIDRMDLRKVELPPEKPVAIFAQANHIAPTASSPRRCLIIPTHRRQWLLLLRGHFDVLGILRARCARLCGVAGQAWLSSLERLGFTYTGNFARSAMATLSRRGAGTLFLVSPEDPGFDILEQDFGREAVGLRAFQDASVKVAPSMDHMLGARQERQAAVDLLVNFSRLRRARPLLQPYLCSRPHPPRRLRHDHPLDNLRPDQARRRTTKQAARATVG
jgi:hypothetical protein